MIPFLFLPGKPGSPPSSLPDLFDAQTVAFTPDGRTVLVCDYLNGFLIYGKINSTRNGLESVNKLPLCPNWDAGSKSCGTYDAERFPTNVAISPDGKTAIINDAF